jgi:hypothetical protein
VLKNKAPPPRVRFAALRCLCVPLTTEHNMGVTTRGAAQRKAKAEATNLLDMPDEVLEPILIAASDSGEWCNMRSARLACSRLRAVSYAAARYITVHIGSSAETGLAALEVLPRLGALSKVEVALGYGPGDCFYTCEYENGPDFFVQKAEAIAQAVYE